MHNPRETREKSQPDQRYKMTNVTYFGAVAVETASIVVAAKVAKKVADQDAVRGRVRINGLTYRWSTIQQYEQHGGFVRRKL